MDGFPPPPPDGVGIEKTMLVLFELGRVIKVLPPLDEVPSELKFPPATTAESRQVRLFPENVPLRIALPLPFTKFAPVQLPPPICELVDVMFGMEQVPVADVANTPPDKGLFD